MADYRLFPGASPPLSAAVDQNPVNLGVEFYVVEAGCSLTQIHFWKPGGNTSNDTRIAALYQIVTPTSGTLLTSQSMPVALGRDEAGWVTLTLSAPVALTANVRYRAVVRHPFGEYAATGGYFGPADTNPGGGPLWLAGTASAAGGKQGSYKYNALAMPDESFNGGNYWTDVTVATADAAPLSAINRFDGSSMRNGATIRRWTGSEFRAGAQPRRWTGNAWEPAP